MASQEQLAFLKSMYQNAKNAWHIFPEAAACEAVVETGWGKSKLYTLANNVFGRKQSLEPIFETVSLPTEEVLHGERVTLNAEFVKYPSVADSFADRMATLNRLKNIYAEYYAALNATTPEDFIIYVSKRWSTDPNRAQTCISILHAHRDVLTGNIQNQPSGLV